jgi:hypothetical protein
MGYRRFTDREGNTWEIHDSHSDWEFRPTAGNARPAVRVPAPGYEQDPFELSSEELQRVLDRAPAPRSAPRRSPFKD